MTEEKQGRVPVKLDRETYEILEQKAAFAPKADFSASLYLSFRYSLTVSFERPVA